MVGRTVMPSLACGTEETCVPLSSILERNGSEVPKPGLRTSFQKVLGEKNKSTISFPVDTSSPGTPTLSSCAFLAHSVLG